MGKVENSGRAFRFRPLSDREIFDEAGRLMTQEKRYLDRSLNMEILAAEMEVHRNALSRAVNTFAKTSFSDWLASYRIAEAERLIVSGKQSLEKLALHAGFPNRTSFYRAFRKIKHDSPAVYFGRREKDGKNKQDETTEQNIE
jgi:AraC-type DNA-binding domain-containing proteins